MQTILNLKHRLLGLLESIPILADILLTELRCRGWFRSEARNVVYP